MPAMKLPSLKTQHVNQPLPIVPRPYKANYLKQLKCQDTLQAMREIKDHYTSLNLNLDNRGSRTLESAALKDSQARIANYNKMNSPKYYNSNYDIRTGKREQYTLGISHKEIQRLQMKELERLHSLSNTQKPSMQTTVNSNKSLHKVVRNQGSKLSLTIPREPSRHLLAQDLIDVTANYDVIENNINNLLDQHVKNSRL
jgi:hypothetical protein